MRQLKSSIAAAAGVLAIAMLAAPPAGATTLEAPAPTAGATTLEAPAPEPEATEVTVVTSPAEARAKALEPRWGVDGASSTATTLAGATSQGLCSYTGLHPTLRRGSSGQAVKHLQCLLRYYHGYSLAMDGYFGWATDSAVRDFQRRHGLVVDGVVGPITWNAVHPY